MGAPVQGKAVLGPASHSGSGEEGRGAKVRLFDPSIIT